MAVSGRLVLEVASHLGENLSVRSLRMVPRVLFMAKKLSTLGPPFKSLLGVLLSAYSVMLVGKTVLIQELINNVAKGHSGLKLVSIFCGKSM